MRRTGGSHKKSLRVRPRGLSFLLRNTSCHYPFYNIPAGIFLSMINHRDPTKKCPVSFLLAGNSRPFLGYSHGSSSRQPARHCHKGQSMLNNILFAEELPLLLCQAKTTRGKNPMSKVINLLPFQLIHYICNSEVQRTDTTAKKRRLVCNKAVRQPHDYETPGQKGANCLP